MIHLRRGRRSLTYNARMPFVHPKPIVRDKLTGVIPIKARFRTSRVHAALLVFTLALGSFALSLPAAAQTSADNGDLVARGSTRPSRLVLLNAPIDGILQDVPIEEGADVDEGELLAQMDDSLQQLRVATAELEAGAEARIEAARLRLEEAEAILARTQQAFERGSAPEWELFSSKLEARLAKSSLSLELEERALAEAKLELERRTLTRYQLRAPFAGRVLRVDKEPGASMTREDRIIQLAALDELEAIVYAPVEWYGSLRVGARYQLEAGPPVKGNLVARMKVIDPVLDPGSQTFRCLLIIENDDGELPGGFSVVMRTPNAVAAAADDAAE